MSPYQRKELDAQIERAEWDVNFQQDEIGRQIEELARRRNRLKALKAKRGDLQL